VVLVVGSIHGDEPGGRAVVAALRRVRPPAGVTVWTVRSANPDGDLRATRGNARGVDLNRNFPHRWRGAGRRGDRYWPGPAAASEPETRTVVRLVERLEPDLTIHYHQPYGLVVRSERADPALLREYAQRSGLPVRSLPAYRGTAAGWQNARRRGTALVVELAGGAVERSAARRHARAVLAVARMLVPPSDR
jgi:protein MpaA